MTAMLCRLKTAFYNEKIVKIIILFGIFGDILKTLTNVLVCVPGVAAWSGTTSATGR